MPHYQHILFDLDHTLWDFEKNAEETLAELYDDFCLAELGSFTLQEFCRTFHHINYHLWHLHQTGVYNQVQLRAARFPMIFSELKVAEAEMPLSIAEAYLKACPTKTHVFPHTHSVLDYLSSQYQLHIVTNGFADVQLIKLQSAGIIQYFEHIVTSDDAGCCKPDPAIFQHTLELIGTMPQECMMIGDNPHSDIGGAQAVGIDCTFFNPLHTPHQLNVKYEIDCLSKLKGIL